MKRSFRSVWFLAGAMVLLLCWASGAFATDFAITGWSGQLWGEYTSPYTTNNPAVGSIACDDFGDYSYLNQMNTYQQASASSLIKSQASGVWGNGGNYEVAAYLALKIFHSSGNMLMQEYYNWALWSYFDPTNALAKMNSSGVNQAGCEAIFGVGAWNGSCNYDPEKVGGLIGDAEQNAAAAYASGAFDNMVVYTPMGKNDPNSPCGQGGQYQCQSQEFFGLVPDGGSALAYLGLVALACLGAAYYSRRNPAFQKAL